MIKPPQLPPGQPISPVGSSAPVQRVRNDGAGRSGLVTVSQSPPQRPPLAVGEVVTARLVEPLPNQQWAVVVKNAVFVLKLAPPGAEPDEAQTDGAEGDDPAHPRSGLPGERGQTLSLRVATVSPRLTFVLASAWPGGQAGGDGKSVALQLSSAARTLMALAQASEQEPAANRPALPASLIAALTDPNASALQRAQALAQAVRQSGLFYEAHLNAWTQGRLPLERLKQEPQARAGLALSPQASGDERAAANAELGRVMQRQLDALDGRPLVFADQAWPGQALDWSIERDPDAPAQGDDDAAEPGWSTQLNLILPALGALGARLRVTGRQVHLAFDAGSPQTAELLNHHRSHLALRLQAAGLQMAAMTVAPHEADTQG